MKLPAGGPQRGTLDDKLPAGYSSRPRTRPVGVCVAMVPRLQGNTVRQYTQSGLRDSSGETTAALGWEMQRKPRIGLVRNDWRAALSNNPTQDLSLTPSLRALRAPFQGCN